jgi:ABC-type lipoprotein export system ATPase subunit
MPIIEITDLVLVPPGRGRQYRTDRLSIAPGDVIAIVSDIPVDARPLLRVLATLDPPAGGRYRFDDSIVVWNDYRASLSIKRRIGYVTADAAMISNMTVRENLLLARYYFENRLDLPLDEHVARLCEAAGIAQHLEQRPAVLSEAELLKAITIREMAKAPMVMLVERPENFMDITEDDAIFETLKAMVLSGTAVVFYSRNHRMTDLANRQLILAGERISTRIV